MALDGLVISNIVYEIKKLMLAGKIDKIYQPESDEIILQIRGNGANYRLLLNSNSNYPRSHITNIQRKNPLSPPMFCMLLRKHLSGGKLIDVVQPDFERIIEFHIENINELGDLTVKKLIIEIMGRHSNIILTDEKNCILDSVIRVSKDKSSVREVLPGKIYQRPPSQDKINPLSLEEADFVTQLKGNKGTKLQQTIYKTFTGISPLVASEICHRANIDVSAYLEELRDEDLKRLSKVMNGIFKQVKANLFQPQIIYDPHTGEPVEFSSIDLSQFTGYAKKYYDSVSEAIEDYYKVKDRLSRIKEKSRNIHKIIQNNLERCYKKKEIQIRQLQEVSDCDYLRVFGELITSNIYSISKGMTSFTTVNFYDENMTELTIPLDPVLTPAQNAQYYFNKYNKAKRTKNAVQEQLKRVNEEISYLESLLSSLEASTDIEDIEDIKKELQEEGYIKNKKGKSSNEKVKSKPLHFKSAEGFDIYVGKNNRQNDELTLHSAPTDLWLHTKDIPGSHVIIKTENKEVPEETLLLAAHLAAYYSKARNSSNVPVDYTLRKNVKKPRGAKPGMVIYENQKTLYITPDEIKIKQLISKSIQ
ncbi:MAG TPA: NFACT RNA binding domain-containing protein [Defluviitaleaceae bacterium]|nr:NFACT RNA binding domain-containing protein [Defluviitaleaceae bacterium]HPT75792.1 NFACT RNA binding domain-containing protein [Defluviitaleaceae bacterium]